MLKILSTIGLGILAACSAPAAPPCRADAPAPIANGPTTWIGPCLHGSADGLGVLRVARRNQAPRLFFGKMVKGRPFSGVMSTDTGDWRPAWRFDARLQPREDPNGDRQSSLQTFDLAAGGAREASRRYRAAGNIDSARFYDQQSRKLAEALD